LHTTRCWRDRGLVLSARPEEKGILVLFYFTSPAASRTAASALSRRTASTPSVLVKSQWFAGSEPVSTRHTPIIPKWVVAFYRRGGSNTMLNVSCNYKKAGKCPPGTRNSPTGYPPSPTRRIPAGSPNNTRYPAGVEYPSGIRYTPDTHRVYP
jgi:hypothetical protein